MIHFTLYSRSWCHLCDDMLQALEKLQTDPRFEIEVVDVDRDEGLLALYDELVPVLLGRNNDGEAVRLCHYFLDEARVKAFLSE